MEPLFVSKLATLSTQLLSDPYFAQGSFDYASSLLLLSPDIDSDIPILSAELQNIIAKSFAKSAWFDIQVLDTDQPSEAIEHRQSCYILQTVLQQNNAENQAPRYSLSFKLIDNRFNTVEIQIIEKVSLKTLSNQTFYYV